jgi:tetratricopeptide (TPR) repeat protein
MACRSRKENPESPAIESPLHDLLVSTRTPMAASTAIKEAEFTNCADLVAVLRSLDARKELPPFSGRTTLGLIEEALDASRLSCPKKDQKKCIDEMGATTSGALAFSLIAADPQVALGKLAAAEDSAAILRRRAQLFFALKQHNEGRDALAASLAFEDDQDTRVRVAQMFSLDGDPTRALQLCEGHDDDAFGVARAGALTALGRYKEAIAQIDQAPLHLRQEVAEAAARHAQDPMALASESMAGAELLLALRMRMGAELDDRGAGLLERAVLLSPDDGDLWMELAETLEASERQSEAIAAWDEAAKWTPGAERPLLAPIRILHDLHRKKEALARAKKLSSAATGTGESAAEGLRMASLAYRYAGDAKQAVVYGRRALANRPGDGRLVFELSARLQEANNNEESARMLADLLVCGARGQAWHRHEVAASLVALVGKDFLADYISTSSANCSPVDAEDLREHVESVR